jgi:hypothetical protein
MADITPRERVHKTLRFEKPDRAPRDLWVLPGAQTRWAVDIATFYDRFPIDFTGPAVQYGDAKRASGAGYHVGRYTDAWGSVWEVAQDGVVSEVAVPSIAEWDALSGYEPPLEILDEADFSRVNASCAATDHYVKAGSTVRPFERMQFLRGSEQFFYDLAEDSAHLYQLRDMVHDFFLRELRMWAETDVDGVSFMDDWRTQSALLISPTKWREFYKPMYRDYCDILHAAGKDVWFHTDGHTEAISPDLIEIGVDALNSQLFCMDIEKLAREHRGQVTFWGEIDRQAVLAFGDPDDCRAAVRRVRAALDQGEGGVIAQCEWGIDTPPENVNAVFETWLE